MKGCKWRWEEYEEIIEKKVDQLKTKANYSKWKEIISKCKKLIQNEKKNWKCRNLMKVKENIENHWKQKEISHKKFHKWESFGTTWNNTKRTGMTWKWREEDEMTWNENEDRKGVWNWPS